MFILKSDIIIFLNEVLGFRNSSYRNICKNHLTNFCEVVSVRDKDGFYGIATIPFVSAVILLPDSSFI